MDISITMEGGRIADIKLTRISSSVVPFSSCYVSTSVEKILKLNAIEQQQ